MDRLKALLKLPPGGCLLDSGGGTGRVSQYLANTALAVVVGDINASMLTPAKRKRGLQPLQLDAAALPFASESLVRMIVGVAKRLLANGLGWCVLSDTIAQPHRHLFST